MTPDIPPRNPSLATTPAVRIAYIVLAHSDPCLFGRLMRRLSHPEAAAFVHLDAKVSQAPFEKEVIGLPNVQFVVNRIHAQWAGFSLVEATIRAFKIALAATGERCTHFVVISGADYPVASNRDIIDFFSRYPERQFVRRFAVMESGDAHQVWRIRGRFFREAADRFTWQRKPLFVAERLCRLVPRRLPKNICFVIGSQWIALTRSCAAYCVDTVLNNTQLVDFFRPTFAPDEIFLHTLVQNSHFVKQADPIEPYVDITKIGGPFAYSNVHVLTPKVPITTADEAHAILAKRGDKLFTRKLSSVCSGPALDVFDTAVLRSP